MALAYKNVFYIVITSVLTKYFKYIFHALLFCFLHHWFFLKRDLCKGRLVKYIDASFC